MTEIVQQVLADDGDIPNNERLPLILYKGAVDVSGPDPDGAFEEVFHANGWGNGWRGAAIFSFHHYHARAHEVVGIAQGRARLQFGGPEGPVIDVEAGDAALIPAGVGHCRLDDEPGLSVVGAYPPGQAPDMNREGETDRAGIRARIAEVALPLSDPLMGKDGPAITLWRTPGVHAEWASR
jgi:uncharacterized protein YjlB